MVFKISKEQAQALANNTQGKLIETCPNAEAAPIPPPPELPTFDGKTTEATLVTKEGNVVSLRSGDTDPKYAVYPAAGHAEAKAAIWIRENGSAGGVVYHNNPSGTCGMCNSNIPTLLPKDAILTVVPPANAASLKPNAVTKPKDYRGNGKSLKTGPPQE